MNDYYVYLYWRLDTMEVFYVGKGHRNRWKRLDRKNNHFMNIIYKHPIAVTIEKDNLTEQEAFYWEEKIIEILVFEYGYSINIHGNDLNNRQQHLANCTWGGEGCSGYKHTKESRDKINNREYKQKGDAYNSKRVVCLNTKEIFECIEDAKDKYHASEIGRVCKGERMTSGKLEDGTRLNWMYYDDYLNISDEKITNIISENNKKYKEKQRGLKNHSSKSVICLTTKRIFFNIREGGEFYNIKNFCGISKCCKGIQNYCGKLPNGTKLVWKYLNWKHNKKYRIKKINN